MKYRILDSAPVKKLQPLTCGRGLLECEAGGMSLKSVFEKYFATLEIKNTEKIFTCRSDFFPSENILRQVAEAEENLLVTGQNGASVAWLADTNDVPEGALKTTADDECIFARYPWDILALNETLVGALGENEIKGIIREKVTIDGFVKLGRNSVILPGVYIEGNVVIGENCKIGPNCYIRGNTAIGSGCHVGQAVEVKNSILMDNVSIGHLSYCGDSIICPGTNFGAGTLTANFRHDGKHHRSMINGELVDTGRRKFGAVIGNGVHTGIHTSIYPGRKIWPGKSTRPGDVVQKDIIG
jgi:acetyltransferase-like isoleucine patch superfamily enzyme